MSDANESTLKKAATIAAIVVPVPAALVALLVLWDRGTDNHSAPTSSPPTRSTPSSPPDTSTPNDETSTLSPSSTRGPTLQTSTQTPSTTQRQSPSTTSQEPPPIANVDHIEISTWAYDKTGLNTYAADNNGGKSIRVSWTASANGHEVNGACASSVRIQGQGTDQAKNSSNCSNSMGSYLNVRQPGNYTVTVTTRQDSGAEHSDDITVTIQP